VRKLVTYYARGYHSIRMLSPCTLPRTGPAILICNHTSAVDPLLLQAASHRLITWMMAREYYSIAAMRWFFDRIAVIPVERSGKDFAATRSAFRALEAGRVLGVFPEGRIIAGRQIAPFQTGAALLAIKSGAPVYPAALEGAMRDRDMLDAFFYPAQTALAFGPEVRLDRSDSSRRALEAATDQMHDAITRLHAQAFSAFMPVQNREVFRFSPKSV
jgi:1-acyl-sn-glycerol-3-phosphate acyltransferase